MIFLLFVVLLILWLIQRQWKMRRILKFHRQFPSKYKAWPFIGHGLMLLGGAKVRMRTIQKIGRDTINSENGFLCMWLGSQPCIVTSDPTIAEMVTTICLGKTEEIVKIGEHLTGNASVFAPVNIWQSRRKMLAPAFSINALRRYTQIFAKESQVLMQCLNAEVGNTITLYDYIASYTLDAVCQTFFGITMNAQKQPLHPFLTALDGYLSLAALQVIQPSLYLKWLYKFIPGYKRSEEFKTIIHNFISEIISAKRNSLGKEYDISASTTLNDASNTSFLEQLISGRCNGSNRYTDVEIHEETLVLTLGGNDTTAAGISFTVVMLSRYLDIQEKAYEEVRTIFGNSKRLVTYEDLPKLKYIEALIKETLRLYPSVPAILRENDVDIELGIVLPAGIYTIINIWALNRNPRHWGVDAEQFNPDRFLNSQPIYRAAYMPFGYGPRNCVGYKYGMMLLKVTVATLLRDYKILPPSDISSEEMRKPLDLEFKFTLKDADKFRVRLEHRV